MHWIDPDCLPEISGTVERFVANRHGEIDGLVLKDDANASLLVHVPPHLTAEIEVSIQAGDRLKIRGVRPCGADMVAAVSITCADGCVIVDEGPDHKFSDATDQAEAPKPSRAQTAQTAGTVRLSLYAPKGELRGVLLDDGTVLRIGPKEARHYLDLLRPGASLAARGEGIETKHGCVIEVLEIRASGNELKPVKERKPDKYGKHRNKEEELQEAVLPQ